MVSSANGNSGELVLDNARAFSGQIVHFAGGGWAISNSDLIDLADINIASVAMNKTSYTQNGIGTLTLYNANGHALDQANANSGVVADDTGPALVVMHDPGPPRPGITVVAAAQIQTSSSLASSDNFAFNFKEAGHVPMTDFHSFSEIQQFGNSAIASIQAILNATHDDSHGNMVAALDGHGGIDSNNVHKTLLRIGDFHIG
jgi:hypothetical protein